MNSKQEILKAIRAQHVAPAELPALDAAWIRYADPLAQFRQLVDSVGGQTLRVGRAADVNPALQALPTFAAAERIVSCVPGVASTVELDSIGDPHQLESVDWAVMPGEFGVAENGAIWVTDAGIKHRAIYFIVQHLALVLPTGEIVHNMHEAYERVTVGNSSLGVFISGPSKTADIEQSLVIGAHGPRSLTVICVDAAD
jgi:L-lactate dehydrogenase complex protein LldG